MTTQDIEIAIREIIRRVYCSEYCGKLSIEMISKCCKSDCCSESEDCCNYGFKISIYLNKDEYPLTLAFDGNLEEFLKFICKELKNRKLHYTKYYYGYQVIKEKEDCNVCK